MQINSGAAFTNSQTVIGGAGGAGGGGGTGGLGAVGGSGSDGVDGTSGSNGAAAGQSGTPGMDGGNGGTGGQGGAGGNGGSGGAGANGGTGMQVTNNAAITNSGTIAGGVGGAGGRGGAGSVGGAGGAAGRAANGGDGGDGALGANGAAGVNPGDNGSAGQNGGNGGSAGNGGSGGAGGNGGNGGAGGAGSAGGAGGTGLSFNSGGELNNQGVITGGNGGAGGVGGAGGSGGTGGTGGAGGSAGTAGAGASGGAGGAGLGGGANGATGTPGTAGNPGVTDSPGNNGVAGATGATGSSGAGGVGVTGANLAIINGGTISGGLSGDGLTRATAILFTGGSNSLTLAAGYSIIGNVVGTGTDTFQLGGSGTGSFNLGSIGSVQQYRGFSTFNVVGGTWTASGTYGQNNAWTLLGGTLNVTGDLSAATGLTVSGGRLMGTGTVGNTTIASGGIFAPGSGTPGSSMTVAGSLALQSGSMYVVMLNPTMASFANVSGTATVSGATVNAFYANGSYISKQYTILTAGSVSGTFGSLVNSNLPSNFTTSLSYDLTHAYLNLALNFTGPNFGSGLNINQQNVANALTNFFNATGGIPLVFGALTPAGLSQASGETATGTQQTTFNAMTQFMGLMTDPFIDGRGGGASSSTGATGFVEEGNQAATIHSDAYAMFGKTPPAPFEARWSTWVAGFGGSQTTDGNATVGSNSATSRVYGTAVGADYRFSPDTIAGFSLVPGITSH